MLRRKKHKKMRRVMAGLIAVSTMALADVMTIYSTSAGDGLDVTSQIQHAISNGYSYACFSFNPNTTGYFRDAGFGINSADAESNHPYLSVAAIPEPASAMILLFGAGIGGAIHRFRRKALHRQ
jgi:hypothetical protein